MMIWTVIEADGNGVRETRRGGTLTGEPEVQTEPEPEQKPDGKKRLYVWFDLPDYKNGLAVAVATSTDEAQRLIVRRLGYNPDDWGPVDIF